MRMDSQCFGCLLSRVAFESELAKKDPATIQQIVETCRKRLEQCRTLAIPAPRIATEIHRTAYRLLGEDDPYAALKEENNAMARGVCAAVSPHLHSFRDRVLASIIGNTMDYAVEQHAVATDFLGFFRQEFRKGLTIDHTDAILDRADRVVYLTDNCGEIVFDRLVIEDLAHNGSQITLVVKGAPILNDATLKDARDLGMDRLADRLTTTGSGDVGICLEKIPPDLSDALGEATLILAKGMANYESLNEVKGLPPVAYLMAVKCEPIARSIGVPRGSYIAQLAH